MRGMTGERRRRVKSRNMYKGPMDKGNGGRLNVEGRGWVGQGRISGWGLVGQGRILGENGDNRIEQQ